MAYGYYEDPGASMGNTGAPAGETFIQRQQRLQKASQPAYQPPSTGGMQPPTEAPAQPPTQVTQQPQGNPSTPVLGNGKIPEAQPLTPPQTANVQAPPLQQASPQQSANIQAPPLQAAPSIGGVDTNALPGGATYMPGANPADPNALVKLPNGQMVPKSHPIYQQFVATAAPAPTPAPTGGPTTGSPGTALGGPAAAAQGPFTQFAPPPHDFQNFQQLDLVSKLLANPETMGKSVQDAMKQKSMEEALLFQQQMGAQLQDQLGSRGFNSQGGLADAQRRKMSESVMNAILGQNRDIEIQASQTNRADQLNALQMAESILGGQVGRSGEVYRNILAGQESNRNDLFRDRSLNLQRELGVGGLEIDRTRVNNQADQFLRQLGFNREQLAENQRQHNNQLGFNYNQLGLTGQNATIDRILAMLGGG